MPQIAPKYKAIIVDDNEIDRLHTVLHIGSFPFLELIAQFSSAEQAIESPLLAAADVLFLDVDMPGQSGLDLRRKIGKDQACIFITSFADYALEGYELAALDYLVKPVNGERFASSMERLHQYLETRRLASLYQIQPGAETVLLKDGHEQVQIRLADIVYLEALKDYTRIVTTQKKYCVLYMLGELLEDPAFAGFVRIHRSYAVPLAAIISFNSQEVKLGNTQLPLGRTYKQHLAQVLNTRQL